MTFKTELKKRWKKFVRENLHRIMCACVLPSDSEDTKTVNPAKSQEEIKQPKSDENIIQNDIIGEILKAMWPLISEMVQTTVLKAIEKSAEKSLKNISGISDFHFIESDLGKHMPTFTNFKLISSEDKNIVIQLDIEYDGDCSFEMGVSTNLANFHLGNIIFGIKNFKFKGVMRVELKDLIPSLPLVSALVAYFITPPTINYHLTKAAEFAEHHLIATKLHTMILDLFSTKFVNPNRIVIPLGVKDASIYRWPLPKYIAKITVIQCHDLKDADGSIILGKSDPYIKLFMDIDNQDKTPTIADNLNPVWNHETYFKVYEGDDTIQFNVFDEDFNADDDIGKYSVKLNDTADFWEESIPLQGGENGKLDLRIEKLYPKFNLQRKEADLDNLSQLSETECSCKKLVQFYLGELRGVDTENHVYKAEIKLITGENIDLGQEAHKKNRKTNSLVFDNVKHQFIENSVAVSGCFLITRIKHGEQENIGKFDFDLKSGKVEKTHSDLFQFGHSINARVTVQSYSS